MTGDPRTSPWRFRGYTIWPILDDDTGKVLWYDIMRPCGCHRPTGTTGCDCASSSEPEDTAHTPEEARAIIIDIQRTRRAFGAMWAD